MHEIREHELYGEPGDEIVRVLNIITIMLASMSTYLFSEVLNQNFEF
jgi:hypothetical protein